MTKNISTKTPISTFSLIVVSLFESIEADDCKKYGDVGKEINVGCVIHEVLPFALNDLKNQLCVQRTFL